MADIPLQFPNIGNALSQGAHAGYFAAEARQKADEEARRQAAAPFVAPAMSGNQAALAQLATADPKTFATIMPRLAQADANTRAKVKDAAEYSSYSANAILQAPPADRPAIHRQLYAEGVRRGYDMSNIPAEYSPAIDGTLRGIRLLSQHILENDTKFKLEDRKDARHNSPGGINQGSEIWGTPGPSVAPAPAAPPRVASPRVSEVTPEALPPTQAAAVEPGTASGSITATNQTAAAPVGQPSPGPLAPEGVTPGSPPIGGPQPAPPAGFEPMGHRDPQGNLVPALIDGKPVYRNPQNGEMRLGDAAPPRAAPVQMAQAAPPATPSAGNVAGGSRTSPRVVYEDPAVQGGQIGQFKAPNGKTELIVGPGGTSIYKMPDGSFQAWKPGLKTEHFPTGYEADPTAPGRIRPIPGGPHDTMSPNNPDGLTGDEFVKTLPPERAAQLKALKEGRMAMSPRLQASKDGKQLMSDLMSAYPDDYDSILNGQRQKTANEFAVGTAAKNVTALNTAIQHLGEVHRLGSDLHNYETPILNTVTNFAQGQAGDRRITDFETAKHAVVEEISKVFRGMGQSDAEIKAWETKINSSQSPQQLQGQIETITHLLNGRIDALGEQYKTGMGGSVPPLQILTPQSKATLDYVNKNKIVGRVPAAAPQANTQGATPKLGANGEGYESIPAGGQYIAPDGSTRTKGGK